MRRTALFLVAVLLVLWQSGRADAQIYRWVDDNGVPHFTDGIDSVPDRYRSKAVPLGMRVGPPAPAAPGAPGAKASGETAIQFIPGQRIMVDARINGNAEARLMLDTGADRTLISPRALQAAGVRLTGPSTTAEVTGAMGSGQMQFIVIDSLEVGEARVGRMPVGSGVWPPDVGDGLLRRDFLDQSHVNIDSGNGLVTLTPK